MKIKQIPEDFIVQEQGEPKLSAHGVYGIYSLAKENIGTLEAINTIRNTWGIDGKNISVGGLKDRHARTEQLISIFKGPPKDYNHTLFNLKYLGRSEEAILPASFTHNRFVICLRDLTSAEALRAKERIGQAVQFGIPNYFDAQRFGSVRGGNEFSAKLLIKGDYEGALKIALTSTSGEDRLSVREIRTTIKEYWGRWRECLAALPRSSERSIINYLKDHPNNFRTAYELMDKNLVLLYLNAYQSYIWNKGVARLITQSIGEDQIIRYQYMLGDFIYYESLSAETLDILKNMVIPFVSHRTEFKDAKIRLLFDEILKEEGLEMVEFRIRGMKKTYFRKAERRMIIFPSEVKTGEIEKDDLNAKKYRLTLDFKLPRGAYATILIKRLSYDFDKSN